MFKLRVEGFKEIEQAMMALPHVTAKASARRVLKKAADPIAEDGAANAPEWEGHLKESYGVGTRLTRRQRKSASKDSEVEVYVGPNDPAAIQTEFGNDHQSAEPHLRPAWDANKDKALEIIKAELWSDVQKSLTRFKRRQARKG